MSDKVMYQERVMSEQYYPDDLAKFKCGDFVVEASSKQAGMVAGLSLNDFGEVIINVEWAARGRGITSIHPTGLTRMNDYLRGSAS